MFFFTFSMNLVANKIEAFASSLVTGVALYTESFLSCLNLLKVCISSLLNSCL